jgi:Flp pilus assembly protein CpaB
VAVATRDLAPGDVVDDGAVAVRALPMAAVASAAVSDAPVGATVRQAIPAGEPLVAERLAPDGLSGAAALVPAGHRAVAVPVGPAGRPPLAVGDLVDVVVVLPADLPPTAGADGAGGDEADGGSEGEDSGEPPAPSDPAGPGDPAFPLVERAAVVDVGEQAVTVAVPEGDASRVAWAVTSGAVVLALSGA